MSDVFDDMELAAQRDSKSARIERLEAALAECHAAMERAAVLIAGWTSACDYRAESDLREAWKVLCAVRK